MLWFRCEWWTKILDVGVLCGGRGAVLIRGSGLWLPGEGVVWLLHCAMKPVRGSARCERVVASV